MFFALGVKICKNGYNCHFTEDAAHVVDQQGSTVCTFKKQNGIYVSRMKLRAPKPFGGQALPRGHRHLPQVLFTIHTVTMYAGAVAKPSRARAS